MSGAEHDNLTIYTIYAKPLDYPDGYVLVEWIVDGATPKRGVASYVPSLEAARNLLPPHLYRMERQPDDDPAIAESWI